MTGGGMSSGPFQRDIQIRHINDGETGEKFFRLGVRTIVDLPLPVAHRDGRRSLRRLQSRATDKDTRGLKGFTVSPPSRYRACLFAASEVFL
jgi:hypothetical protein